MKTQPSCSLCSLCCTFLKSDRLLCCLQLNGCHTSYFAFLQSLYTLLCVYFPLADVDGCLASAWLGCQIFVRYSLERQRGRNKIGVCSLSRNLESCNRHMHALTQNRVLTQDCRLMDWPSRWSGWKLRYNDSCLAYYFGAF